MILWLSDLVWFIADLSLYVSFSSVCIYLHSVMYLKWLKNNQDNLLEVPECFSMSCHQKGL